MRTWVKVTVGGVALVAVGLVALAGTGAYYVFRNLERRSGSEADAVRAIEAVKTRFGPRPPLVEVIDLHRADIRVNRADAASPSPVHTVHMMNWKSDTGEFMRADVPLWLMRFSSMNILSQLGVAPSRFRLTVSDIERYGPGIVLDYGTPRAFRVLVWVE